MIRTAEFRDIGKIQELFLKLLNYLEEKEQRWYVSGAPRENGVAAYIIDKIFKKDSLVVVYITKEEEVTGFLIGALFSQPHFFVHKLWAKVEWMYPADSKSREMIRIFGLWARSKGAEVEFSDHFFRNIHSMRVAAHDGRKLGTMAFYKVYGGKE